MTDTVMDAGASFPHAESRKKPLLNLFATPPTDLSMSRYRFVLIQTYTTGITPVEFQMDPLEDYVDLSWSFFEIELTFKQANGDNIAAARTSGLHLA